MRRHQQPKPTGGGRPRESVAQVDEEGVPALAAHACPFQNRKKRLETETVVAKRKQLAEELQLL